MSDAAESGFRFERKYHICDATTREVEHWVHRCPALFSETFTPRWVNNIYLDSPGLAAYFQNLAGLADRTKVRVRWYGPLLGPIQRPILEFKIKRGLVGTKESHPLKPFTLAHGFDREQLRSILDGSDLPPPVQFNLGDLELALINRYHRKYFLSADGNYRITVDSGLEFYRVHRHDNQFLSRSTFPDSTIMELKYSGAIAELDDRITNFFPFRVTRMSKYVAGLEGVEG